MNDKGGLGITAAILLITFILIAATATSVIMDQSGKISEQDIEKMTNEIVDELSTYIQIKDMVGKYYTINEKQRIQKIAILIKPLISIDIDVSTLTIKIHNGQQIRMLYYSGQAAFIHSHSLFEHQIWDEMNHNSFSFIVTLDKDRSLVDHDTINDNTDTAYIIIKLPQEFTMKKGDSITITLFPSTGITRTKTVVAPLPIKQIVTFE